MAKKHKVIPININIDTGYKAHCRLSKLYNEVFLSDNVDVILDFSNVNFIAANQFAVIGCIANTFTNTHPNCDIYFSSVKGPIKTVMQKNGLHRHLGLKKIPDKYNTTIPFFIFDIDDIDEFEKYIVLQIFGRSDLPRMTQGVRNRILDNILEIFNNVKEHTSSRKVYTCGQFFPKSYLLFLTIVDAGETIPYNVNRFFERKELKPPAQTLPWAISAGNTTRITTTPGGLGLSFLCDFIKLNKGKLYIVSGNETFEKDGERERNLDLEYAFPGTIVTVAFNLSDEYTYRMMSENVSEILF